MAISFEPLFRTLFLYLKLQQDPVFTSGNVMKEWLVIHQIKSLHNNGNGLSEHKIAKKLGISRNTVR